MRQPMSSKAPWGRGGVALLIKAGVVCQYRHITHRAITIGRKWKHRARLLQPLQQICCFTMEARCLTSIISTRLLWLRVSVSVCTVLLKWRSSESETQSWPRWIFLKNVKLWHVLIYLKSCVSHQCHSSSSLTWHVIIRVLATHKAANT